MSKGFILKVLESVLSAEFADQIEAAKDMLQHGYDANEEQWQALNSKVEKSDRAKQSPQPEPGRDSGKVIQGTKGHTQYVSNAEPGELGNQIGYPGTTQDQDEPGQKNRTPPGVKPPKHDKK